MHAARDVRLRRPIRCVPRVQPLAIEGRLTGSAVCSQPRLSLGLALLFRIRPVFLQFPGPPLSTYGRGVKAGTFEQDILVFFLSRTTAPTPNVFDRCVLHIATVFWRRFFFHLRFDRSPLCAVRMYEPTRLRNINTWKAVYTNVQYKKSIQSLGLEFGNQTYLLEW
jgi:hypothetical protein